MNEALSLATWNINSLRVRLGQVLRWMADVSPDILMIQEIKGEAFPLADFSAIGYDSACVLQKSWNGVAILAREKPEIVLTSLPGDDGDGQARYLEANIAGIRCINVYLPNGNPVESEKYPYKLAWMARLRDRLACLRAEAVPFVVGGDFNVIPENVDCHDARVWSEDALFRPETRRMWRSILNLGLLDAFRMFHEQEAGAYTFWDYQGHSFEAGKGIRIDHFLLSPALADRASSCTIDAAPRAWDQPSDHVPVILSLSSEESRTGFKS